MKSSEIPCTPNNCFQEHLGVMPRGSPQGMALQRCPRLKAGLHLRLMPHCTRHIQRVSQVCASMMLHEEGLCSINTSYFYEKEEQPVILKYCFLLKFKIIVSVNLSQPYLTHKKA